MPPAVGSSLPYEGSISSSEGSTLPEIWLNGKVEAIFLELPLKGPSLSP